MAASGNSVEWPPDARSGSNWNGFFISSQSSYERGGVVNHLGIDFMREQAHIRRHEGYATMKMVFTAPSVIPCDMVKGLLEANGIPSMFKNEQGSAGFGVGMPVPGCPSVAWAWPELWVQDEDYQAAITIIQTAESGEADPNLPPPLPGSNP